MTSGERVANRGSEPYSLLAPHSRLRVLHILEAIDGGTKRHLLDILASLDRERFEVEVAARSIRPETGDGQTFVADVASLGVPFHQVEMRRAPSPLRDLAALWQLVRIIRRGQFDLVHGHSSKGGFLARLAGALTGTPALYTPNGLYFLQVAGGWRRRMYAALERVARPFTTRFIAVSESEREAALREHLVPPEKIVVIPSGVGAREFDRSLAARERIRRELAISRDAVVVGTVSRMTQQKDPESLIRGAAEAMARSARPVNLVWVGTGALEGHVRRLANDLGIADRTHFLGVRRDVRDVLCAFDVFALTSRFEGMPYAVLEAMALGLPVVASDVVGTRDVVRDSVSGYLVPRDDPSRFADALVRLIENEELRAELGEGARALVAERFSLGEMIRALEGVYSAVAPRKSSRRPVGPVGIQVGRARN